MNKYYHWKVSKKFTLRVSPDELVDNKRVKVGDLRGNIHIVKIAELYEISGYRY
jgi:hypothetical protein